MITWLIGMSGAGKTTIGKKVFENLKKQRKDLVFIDGDEIREIFGNDLGHTAEDRKKNADRINQLCYFLDKNGISAVCCVLSVFEESRRWNRENLSQYKEVYVKVSQEELQRRDTKGLYAGARNGTIENVVGVDIKFEEPKHPSLVIENNGEKSVEEIVSMVENHLLEDWR